MGTRGGDSAGPGWAMGAMRALKWESWVGERASARPVSASPCWRTERKRVWMSAVGDGVSVSLRGGGGGMGEEVTLGGC